MDEQQLIEVDEQIINSRLQSEHMQQAQMARMMEDQNKSLIKEQLDLNPEFKRIYYLLTGYIPKVDENDEIVWVPASTKEHLVLSEAGLNYVLETIAWYLTKITLLSNYDEETILGKMEDFSNALNDEVFMKSEIYFLTPTQEECQQRLIRRLEEKKKNIILNAQLYNEDIDENKVWKKLVEEIDPSVERQKIKEQIMKDRYKSFEMLIRKIQDAVHSTYNRAYGGQERRTLRQHIHISENMNPRSNIKREEAGFFKAR